ncbi:MAG TPA: RDD family protein [Terriglobales bacterium]|nr:RDD family protein [Terriglobales bacterium]
MSTPESPVPPLNIHLSALSSYMSAPGELQSVSFWPRVLARLIDLVIHYIVATVTGFLFGIMLAIAAGGHISPLLLARLRGSGMSAFVLILLGSILFEAICESVHGNTPGKRALGMVVVQEDGSPCRIGSALIRSFAYTIDALFFGLVAYSAIQQTAQEQRLGDKWAETVVCKRSAVVPGNLRGPGRFLLGLFFAAIVDSALCMVALLTKLSA